MAEYRLIEGEECHSCGYFDIPLMSSEVRRPSLHARDSDRACAGSVRVAAVGPGFQAEDVEQKADRNPYQKDCRTMTTRYTAYEVNRLDIDQSYPPEGQYVGEWHGYLVQFQTGEGKSRKLWGAKMNWSMSKRACDVRVSNRNVYVFLGVRDDSLQDRSGKKEIED